MTFMYTIQVNVIQLYTKIQSNVNYTALKDNAKIEKKNSCYFNNNIQEKLHDNCHQIFFYDFYKNIFSSCGTVVKRDK